MGGGGGGGEFMLWDNKGEYMVGCRIQHVCISIHTLISLRYPTEVGGWVGGWVGVYVGVYACACM